MTDNALSIAAEVLAIEAAELNAGAKKLDQNFTAAVEAILACEGKVVVAGLGKSGHVGRKIAATLSSTGTPAFFLHPAEALHGDLGVIGTCDCMLIIAFGGETQETLEVARFARRRAIPIIALTGKTNSSLARLASHVLDGSVEHEACPLNLAPTSSTTLALALGDALAVCLMRLRGFGEKDFASFHPSGSLGRRLSLVADHMRKDIAVLQRSDGFKEVLAVLTQENFGVAAVLGADHQLIGAISDGDLRRALLTRNSDIFALKAAELMSLGPKTIAADALAMAAVQKMESLKISSLFVVDKAGGLAGLVRMYDLLEAKIV